MAKATSDQTANTMEQDINIIREYCAKVKEHADRQARKEHCFNAPLQNCVERNFTNPVTAQGAMDIKYLATRYNKGKAAVTSFMDKKHQYQTFEKGLSASQAHLLAWQAESAGSSLFFGCILPELTLWVETHENQQIKNLKPTFLINQGPPFWLWIVLYGLLAPWTKFLCGLIYIFLCHSVWISLLLHWVMWGALCLDEAAEMGKSICHGNCNAIIMVLLPVVHASTHQAQVVKNRRAIEDMLMGWLASAWFIYTHPLCCGRNNSSQSFSDFVEQEIFVCVLHLRSMEVIDIALQFCDSGHAGDKRKRTQPCSLAEGLESCDGSSRYDIIFLPCFLEVCFATPTSTASHMASRDLRHLWQAWSETCKGPGSMSFFLTTMSTQQTLSNVRFDSISLPNVNVWFSCCHRCYWNPFKLFGSAWGSAKGCQVHPSDPTWFGWELPVCRRYPNFCLRHDPFKVSRLNQNYL